MRIKELSTDYDDGGGHDNHDDNAGNFYDDENVMNFVIKIYQFQGNSK